MAVNSLGISTETGLLDVELSATLMESPSVATFLQEEDASICPLLSTANETPTPLTLSHPLTPCIDNDSNISGNLCNEDSKVESSSSTGSSSGIGMDVPDSAIATLFSKHIYQHLQNNNNTQDNGHITNNKINLSKDAPVFVSWNWPLIRKCTLLAFISTLLGMCVLVVAMIITLPKTCNPKTAWYRGGVFYEIFPASFHDSNNDGIGDIRGIANRIDHLDSIYVSAIRLNSIFPSPHYPDDCNRVSSLFNIADVLGSLPDIQYLSETLHKHNISLILDLPIYEYATELKHSFESTNKIALENNWIQHNQTNGSTSHLKKTSKSLIGEAMIHWMKFGVDGFYIKGLDKHIHEDMNIVESFKEWKNLIGSDRVLIINEHVIKEMDAEKRNELLKYVDLVDVYLNVFNGTILMENRIQSILNGELVPFDSGVWIHWSIGGFELDRVTGNIETANTTLAATIMQLMLPGTPNIFYEDEITLENEFDLFNEHSQTKHLHHLSTMQMPLEQIKKMVILRNRSPSIYKNAICKAETKLPNTQIRRSHDDIIVIERVYPRRNSFVSISNFGQKRVNIDMTSIYYSGIEMLKNSNTKIYFANFEIGSQETIVIKLDK